MQLSDATARALKEMAVADDQEPPDVAQTILEHSYLTYIVPYATDFKVDKAISHRSSSGTSRLEGIRQREWLFFGTKLFRAAPL